MSKSTSWTPAEFSAGGSRAFLEMADRPLCLYVHVPFCRHRCSFCPFFINQCREGFSSWYGEALLRDIDLTASLLGDDRFVRRVTAVYFGGGTPSDMESADMQKVLARLKENFCIDTDTEITIEGRVRDFSAAKAKAFVEAGANRFSLGVQSTHTDIRRRLGRLADRDEIKEVLNGVGESGAVTVVDLLYGLPGQKAGDLREDIRFLASETSLDGLDLYQLRLFPGSSLARAIEQGKIPSVASPQDCEKLLEEAEKALHEYHFENFHPRHWRRRHRERSLYNQYAHGEADILPFGSAAGGRVGDFSLSLSRDLAEYRTMLEAGQKPLA